MILIFSFASAFGQEVENLEIKKNAIQIVFTGHTYPLLLADLQYFLADEVNKHDYDFVVLGGDVVAGPDPFYLRHTHWHPSMAEEQWEKFLLFQSRLGKPVYYVPGNHDLSHDTDMIIKQYMQLPSFYYAKQHRSFLFIFLNTVDTTEDSVRYQLDKEQLTWLTELLKNSEGISTVFFFMHHQLWNLEELPRRFLGDTNQFKRDIKPLLSKYQSVYLIAGDNGYVIGEYGCKDHTPQTEGNIQYHAFSNMVVHGLGYVGFLLIAVDFDTNDVAITLETKIPPNVGGIIRIPKPTSAYAELLVRAKHVVLSKRFWAGVVAAVFMFMCLVLLHRLKRSRPSEPVHRELC